MTESKARLRRNLKPDRVEADGFWTQILNHPWFREAGSVMAYSALPGEVDLTTVLQEVLAQGKTLLLPRCGETGLMTARRVLDLADLETGKFGIREPSGDAPVFPVGKIDLILVPGLAFDSRCRRLGRGGGYYDRFLTGCTGKTMGICQILLPEVPVEEHDIKMNAVITADRIFYETEVNPCLRKN